MSDGPGSGWATLAAKLLDHLSSGPTSLAICLTCALTIWANAHQLITLSALSPAASTIVIIVGIFSAVRTIYWAGERIVSTTRRSIARRRNAIITADRDAAEAAAKFEMLDWHEMLVLLGFLKSGNVQLAVDVTMPEYSLLQKDILKIKRRMMGGPGAWICELDPTIANNRESFISRIEAILPNTVGRQPTV